MQCHGAACRNRCKCAMPWRCMPMSPVCRNAGIRNSNYAYLHPVHLWKPWHYLARSAYSLLYMLTHHQIIQLLAPELPTTYVALCMDTTVCLASLVCLRLLWFDLQERDVAWIMKGIMSAVQHCHAMNVLHRDIKPENFLLEKPPSDNQKPCIKITDFGLSTFAR
jgi:serine/threonine protein kinase